MEINDRGVVAQDSYPFVCYSLDGDIASRRFRSWECSKVMLKVEAFDSCFTDVRLYCQAIKTFLAPFQKQEENQCLA